jgi:putative transposase
LLWIPKSRTCVLTGPVAVRARDVVRQSAVEHEIDLMTGKGASAQVPMFLHYQPHRASSKIVQGLKGLSSRVRLPEFAHLRKQFWGRPLWARGYRAVSAGTSTDELSQKYIEEQEGEPMIDDRRFTIDS